MKLSGISPILKTINLYPCEKGFCTKERFIPNSYFLYVHKGSGSFIIDGKKYNGFKGDLFYCPNGVSNNIIADEENPFTLSGIDFFFSSLKADMCSFDDFDGFKSKINITSESFALLLINEMIEAFKNKAFFSAEYTNSLLKAFILLIAQITKHEEIHSKANVKELLSYIERNFTQEITAYEISQMFNYHTSSINRMIKSVTGYTVKQYQINLRLKKALDLLIYTNKSITEIATLCGYNSIFYFSRQFYEKTGVIPSAYRKNITKL